MGLANQIQLLIKSVLTDTVGLAAQEGKIQEVIDNPLTTVVCDALFSATGVITDSLDEYDLAGALEDPIGDDVIFAKVMCLFIRNTSENAMTISAANNIPLLTGSTDKLNLAAEAYILYVDQNGIAVTGGTGDLISIAGTTDDTYELIVIGSSS